jgi:hypothetical protein
MEGRINKRPGKNWEHKLEKENRIKKYGKKLPQKLIYINNK